jgi:hypothetical protein
MEIATRLLPASGESPLHVAGQNVIDVGRGGSS